MVSCGAASSSSACLSVCGRETAEPSSCPTHPSSWPSLIKHDYYFSVDHGAHLPARPPAPPCLALAPRYPLWRCYRPLHGVVEAVATSAWFEALIMLTTLVNCVFLATDDPR